MNKSKKLKLLFVKMVCLKNDGVMKDLDYWVKKNMILKGEYIFFKKRNTKSDSKTCYKRTR